MIHHTWDLSADLFDGDLLAGLVPTIYAADPDSMPDILKRDLIKVRSHIIEFEALSRPMGHRTK